MSSLELQIRLRKINTFGRLALLLTRPGSEPLDDPLASKGDAAIIFRILETRVIPELRVLDTDIVEIADARRQVVRLTLDCLCLGGNRVVDDANTRLLEWWMESKRWKSLVEQEISDLVRPLSVLVYRPMGDNIPPSLDLRRNGLSPCV